jgi:hypothetical protein
VEHERNCVDNKGAGLQTGNGFDVISGHCVEWTGCLRGHGWDGRTQVRTWESDLRRAVVYDGAYLLMREASCFCDYCAFAYSQTLAFFESGLQD